MTSIILRPFASALALLQFPVPFFNYPWANTLHAARISLIYQSLASKNLSPLGWKSYMAGFLLMSWGGMLFSHLLLSLPPPAILSIHPYINYLVPHLLLTSLFTTVPSLLPRTPHDLAQLDLILFPVDALLRVNAITNTVSILAPNNTQIHPSLPSSPFFHLLLGAVASAGGGVTASTLDTFSPTWSFSTPTFLRPGIGWVGTMDIWGGALVAAIFSLGTGHPAFKGMLTESEGMWLSQKGAKALGALVLTGLFGFRAVLAWVKVKASQTEMKEKEKEKVQ